MSIHDIRLKCENQRRVDVSRYAAQISRCRSQFTLAMVRTERQNTMDDSVQWRNFSLTLTSHAIIAQDKSVISLC